MDSAQISPAFPPQEGTWTLTAPDGRTWQADKPLRCVAAESRERIPAEVALQRIYAAASEDDWQPIATAPKDGTPFLAWYLQVRLDDDGEVTDETFGGACAIITVKGREWDEPEWLGAHGSYFFEDWCFAETPSHWMPLPKAPGAKP